jgi:quercetin dioxygenase-like cupin family protein
MKPIKAMSLFAAGALSGAVLGASGLALAQAMLPAPTGPQQNLVLATSDLGETFPALSGYILTLRRTTVPPGAGLAVHSHTNLPEIEYIVSGVLSEQRVGGPIVAHGPGAAVVNNAGVTHAVINQGAEPVVYYAASVSRPAKPAAAAP